MAMAATRKRETFSEQTYSIGRILTTSAAVHLACIGAGSAYRLRDLWTDRPWVLYLFRDVGLRILGTCTVAAFSLVDCGFHDGDSGWATETSDGGGRLRSRLEERGHDDIGRLFTS